VVGGIEQEDERLETRWLYRHPGIEGVIPSPGQSDSASKEDDGGGGYRGTLFRDQGRRLGSEKDAATHAANGGLS
jgi:hypothetical protein